MRVACNLREIRERMPRTDAGKRVSMQDIHERTVEAGHPVAGGILSMIERGIVLPTDDQVPAIEHAYGAPVTDWYDARTLLALQADGDDA